MALPHQGAAPGPLSHPGWSFPGFYVSAVLRLGVAWFGTGDPVAVPAGRLLPPFSTLSWRGRPRLLQGCVEFWSPQALPALAGVTGRSRCPVRSSLPVTAAGPLTRGLPVRESSLVECLSLCPLLAGDLPPHHWASRAPWAVTHALHCHHRWQLLRRWPSLPLA